MSANDWRTAENADRICDSLARGKTRWQASRQVGVSKQALECWIREEPGFAGQVRRAEYVGHRKRTPIYLMAGILALLGLIGALWIFLNWYIKPDMPEGRRNLIETLIKISGIVVVVLTLVNARETIRINQESQLTDRYMRAITLLGDDKMEVRLGGIYGLERLAHRRELEYNIVMNILTDFLRERAPWPPRTDQIIAGALRQNRMPQDIQSVLTVVRRRPIQFENTPLDLSNIDLRYASLTETVLMKVNLSGSCLNCAHLAYANLAGTDLSGTKFQAANLYATVFDRANVNGADFRHAVNFCPQSQLASAFYREKAMI